MSMLTALKISGRSPEGNSTSTTVPMTRRTLPAAIIASRRARLALFPEGGLRRALAHPWSPGFLGLLGAALLLPALWAGFQMDDLFHRFALLGLGGPWIDLFVPYSGDPVAHREMLDGGGLPWWVVADFQHANFRYLSVLSMKLDYLLWPSSPALMHLHSLVWMAACIVVTAWLYRDVMPELWIAGLAGLLFALDDAHALPAAYLANRNALIATFFGVLALLSLVRAEHEGPSYRCGLFLALALSAGEIALGIVGYLVAFALFVDRAPPRARALRLAPSALVLISWIALYRLGGFGSRGSGFYLDPSGDPFAFLAALPERASVLLVGQWTPIPADLLLTPSGGWDLFFWPAVLVWSGLILGGVPLLAKSRSARFWAAGMLAALVPIAAAGPQNRLLFFVGIGAMGLLAEWLGQLAARIRASSGLPWREAPALAIASLLLVTHVFLAPLGAWVFLDAQASYGEKIQQAIDSIPDDPILSSQDLVLVNPVDVIYLGASLQVGKMLAGKTPARRVLALAAGAPLSILRLDQRTLEIRHEGGMFPNSFSRFFRPQSAPMAAGDGMSLPVSTSR